MLRASPTQDVSLVEKILVFKGCCKVDEEIKKSTGLNAKEALAVLALDQGAGRSSAELARAIGSSPSRTSRVVDGLVGQGLLERREDPADRRRSSLTLTEAGRRGLVLIRRAALDCERALAHLNRDSRAQAAAGLDVLVAAYQGAA